jgi:predicted phosphodiesterase
MQVGLLSDIHANLQALRTVLARMEEEGVDRLLCLGDVVGYGGDPEACVELVRQRVSVCILGNHDAAAVHPWARATFNAAARVAVEAHAQWLDARAASYLAGLPPEERVGGGAAEGLYLVHGTPGETSPFTYLTSVYQAGPAFECFGDRFAAVGHTHVPALYERQESGARARERSLRANGGSPTRDVLQQIEVTPGARAILNPGSVGQPRDGDPRAACMVLDLETGAVRVIRLTYDVEGAQAAIRRRGLPEWLAARLAAGR